MCLNYVDSNWMLQNEQNIFNFPLSIFTRRLVAKVTRAIKITKIFSVDLW